MKGLDLNHNVLEKTEFEQKVASHQKEVEEYQIKKNKEFSIFKKLNIIICFNKIIYFSQALLFGLLKF